MLPSLPAGGSYTDLASMAVAQWGQVAYTRLQYQGGMTNCGYNKHGIYVCDWYVTSYCTPETSPPVTMWTTDRVTDSRSWDFWDSYAYCIHVPLFNIWKCSPRLYGEANAFGLPAPQDRAVCTTVPKT
jgi:hypothetical protein